MSDARPVKHRPSAPAVHGAEAMLLATVILWAGNFTAMRYALERFSPLAYSAVRFALAGALFAAVVWAREGSLRIERRDWAAVVFVAFVGIFLNQVSVTYAVKDAGAANVAMLMATSPIFAAALAAILGHERPTAMHWVGALVCLGGAVLVLDGSGAQLGGAPLRGGIFAILTALTWSVYSVLIRPLMERYSPARLSAVIALLGAVMVLPAAAPQLAGQDWSSIGPGRWGCFAYSLLLALVLTNLLWFVAIRRVGAARATLFMYLEPFIGALIALVLLGEQVHPEQWLGGVAILAGVVLARTRRAAQARTAET